MTCDLSEASGKWGTLYIFRREAASLHGGRTENTAPSLATYYKAISFVQ